MCGTLSGEYTQLGVGPGWACASRNSGRFLSTCKSSTRSIYWHGVSFRLIQIRFKQAVTAVVRRELLKGTGPSFFWASHPDASILSVFFGSWTPLLGVLILGPKCFSDLLSAVKLKMLSLEQFKTLPEAAIKVQSRFRRCSRTLAVRVTELPGVLQSELAAFLESTDLPVTSDAGPFVWRCG